MLNERLSSVYSDVTAVWANANLTRTEHCKLDNALHLISQAGVNSIDSLTFDDCLRVASLQVTEVVHESNIPDTEKLRLTKAVRMLSEVRLECMEV